MHMNKFILAILSARLVVCLLALLIASFERISSQNRPPPSGFSLQVTNGLVKQLVSTNDEYLFFLILFFRDLISERQMMIGVYNHLLSKVFRFHYHSQKVIGSLGVKGPLQTYQKLLL